MWNSSPWVAPKSGPAETTITLSKEKWKHYQRFQLDLDFDVTEIQEPYNCFLELRNVGASNGGPHPWRYFSVCTKNDSGKKAIYVVYGAKTPAAEFAYLTKSFTLQNNTSYHFNIVYDAKALQTSMTLTPAGGQPVTL